ncbi:MAG TPA: PEP-CTERM sorting domain-containing protein [Bryobacteraceae bacterium]|jgi:hypothetical protein
MSNGEVHADKIHLTHDPNFANSWVFLSEVAFDGTTNTQDSVVPEPASGLLACLGFAALSWQSCRRKA